LITKNNSLYLISPIILINMKSITFTLPVFFLSAFLMISCQQGQDNTTPVETAAAPASEAPKPKPMTTIQWLDSSKSIGKVKEGEKIEISYRFKNTGTEMLIINNIVVSCGCTVAEKPEQPIAPGAEGAIKATFDTKGRVGTNHKTMAVYTNTKEAVSTVAFDVEVLAQK
jgi:hypothetical protein